MKNEEYRIFSENRVPLVIRVGLKSLIEESAENPTMKLNMIYNSADNITRMLSNLLRSGCYTIVRRH